jgi:hypothetical protein
MRSLADKTDAFDRSSDATDGHNNCGDFTDEILGLDDNLTDNLAVVGVVMVAVTILLIMLLLWMLW